MLCVFHVYIPTLHGVHDSKITFIVRSFHIKLTLFASDSFEIIITYVFLKIHVCVLKILGFVIPMISSTFPNIYFSTGDSALSGPS